MTPPLPPRSHHRRLPTPEPAQFKGSIRLDFGGSPGTEIIRESSLDTDEGIKTVMWTPEETGEVRVIVDESTGRYGVGNRSSSSKNHPPKPST
ncbi:MAG TPA: hypothetical protein QGG37_10760 [Chloroflexota bacterium]|nr:hypothetical protein [Chloroflexota bacterium]